MPKVTQRGSFQVRIGRQRDIDQASDCPLKSPGAANMNGSGTGREA